MSSQSDRIKSLLGAGLSNEVVASTVGVTPSYISQLMADEDYADQVSQLRVASLTDATERDRSWDALEKKLLGSLHEKLDTYGIHKVNDIVRVLAVANNAKRRGASTPEALTTSRPVVQLTLPTVVIQSYTKTAAGEVIEVTKANGETQSLLTMQASTLLQKLASTKQGSKEIDYDKIRRHLPSSDERESS